MLRTIILQLLLALTSLTAMSQQRIHLWHNTKVHARSVTLDVYLPDTVNQPSRRPTAAVIVCPGGSYCWHDRETEGVEVARWLQSNGIAAFVLNYRVQGIFQYVTHSRLLIPGRRHPMMIQDLQMALHTVRQHAEQWNINPDSVGAMGFSAGGHLVMTAAVYHHTNFLAPLGINVSHSLRPAFVAPIYPVVTMMQPYVHKRSRRALLGEIRKYRHTLRDSLSLERHVPNDCPPVFLVNCEDDPIVKYQNAILLDSALTAQAVPHRYILYKVGGHGFGASQYKGSEECRQWKKEFMSFMRNMPQKANTLTEY